MSKTIIFCADGTWDGPEDATGESVLDSENLAQELAATALTNVVKLYANLEGSTLPGAVALANEDEKHLADAAGKPLQVAKYLHGVGDSKNLLVKLLDGIFGVGVAAWAKAKTLQLNGKGQMTQLASDVIAGFEQFLAAPLDPQSLRPEGSAGGHHPELVHRRSRRCRRRLSARRVEPVRSRARVDDGATHRARGRLCLDTGVPS